MNVIPEKKLLTIGIPTYNRVQYLDKCLTNLLPELKGSEKYVDVIVSDNASSQNNDPVIRKFIEKGYDIRYVKNETNLGMDGNFCSLFEKSNSKYVWMLSDDDVVAPGGVNNIINYLLTEEEIGSLYLNNIWFSGDIDMSLVPVCPTPNFTKFDDPLEYVSRVNYWVTFLSANIINKDILIDKINHKEFNGTFLALLGWIIPAIFQGYPNSILENPILACRGSGQGGYKLIQVFAVNFNKILDVYIKRGYPKKIKEIINLHLLRIYFSPWIIGKKIEGLNGNDFNKENWVLTLFKVYYNNVNFYVYTLPCFLLPNKYYNKWLRMIK